LTNWVTRKAKRGTINTKREEREGIARIVKDPKGRRREDPV